MAVTVFASGTKTPTVGTVTVTIASPGVLTFASNQLANGDAVVLSTTGALPTGLTAGTVYYVVNNGTDGAGKFRLALTPGGADINTTGSQSGTHTMVAEHFLSGPNVAATYQLDIDLSALASGDYLEVAIFKMVLTSGTTRGWDRFAFQGAQPVDRLIFSSVPISTPLTDTNALRFSIRQPFGTGRAIPWSVNKFA